MADLTGLSTAIHRSKKPGEMYASAMMCQHKHVYSGGTMSLIKELLLSLANFSSI